MRPTSNMPLVRHSNDPIPCELVNQERKLTTFKLWENTAMVYDNVGNCICRPKLVNIMFTQTSRKELCSIGLCSSGSTLEYL